MTRNLDKRKNQILLSCIMGASLSLNFFSDNVKIHAESDSLQYPKRVSLINGSFEDPAVSAGVHYLSEMPGWHTTAKNHLIEVWNGNGVVPAAGKQHVELNAFEASTLYQDVETTPGQTIYWRLSHRGRSGKDKMQLQIGTPNHLKFIQEMTDGKEQWGTYTGKYIVPDGQTITRFAFGAVSTAGGDPTVGNFLDDIFLGTEPRNVVEKSVEPMGIVQPGAILTYTVNIKNEGGDISAKTIVNDKIPPGTEYIPGSLQLLSGQNNIKLTDNNNDDQGEFDSNKNQITVRIGNNATSHEGGDLSNTDISPNGETVQFKVKVLKQNILPMITNIANVEYVSLLTANKMHVQSNEVISPAILDSAPRIDAESISIPQDKYSEINVLTFEDLHVKATDKEDGDLTNKIKVIAGKVDPKTPGIYPITYQVTDSANHTTEKEITITVTPDEAPRIDVESISIPQDKYSEINV
ncbi:immunoglobulin-like domain-containing protein, partial [Bacillus cereus]